MFPGRISILTKRLRKALRTYIGKWKKSGLSGAIRFAGEIMGTTYHITVASFSDEMDPDVLSSAAHKKLSMVEEKMSIYRKESELSQFNDHSSTTPFVMSPETIEVFQISQQISAETEGAFDITMGPLVNEWGFGPQRVTGNPDETRIAKLLEYTGHHKIEIRNNTMIVKTHPSVWCDLSAVAKGYGVDKVAEEFDRLGITNYLIEVGGEVRTNGINPEGTIWRLAIERPIDEDHVSQMVVGLSGVALATSGDYRIFRIENGKRFSHVIDPGTGWPATHQLASASVIHPSCAWADAYATAIMVMGPEKGYQFSLDHHLAVYLLIRKDSNHFIACQTPAFSDYMNLAGNG